MNAKLNIVVCKADDFAATCFEIFCPRCIVFFLLYFQVTFTIDLNTKFYFRAIKINDEKFYLVLSPEFVAKISVS